MPRSTLEYRQENQEDYDSPSQLYANLADSLQTDDLRALRDAHDPAVTDRPPWLSGADDDAADRIAEAFRKLREDTPEDDWKTLSTQVADAMCEPLTRDIRALHEEQFTNDPNPTIAGSAILLERAYAYSRQISRHLMEGETPLSDNPHYQLLPELDRDLEAYSGDTPHATFDQALQERNPDLARKLQDALQSGPSPRRWPLGGEDAPTDAQNIFDSFQEALEDYSEGHRNTASIHLVGKMTFGCAPPLETDQETLHENPDPTQHQLYFRAKNEMTYALRQNDADAFQDAVQRLDQTRKKPTRG